MKADFENKHEEMIAALETAKNHFSEAEYLEIIALINEYDKTTEIEDAVRIQENILSKCRKKTSDS